MALAKAGRHRHCGGSVEAPAPDGLADRVGALATLPAQIAQVICAELIGPDRCSGLGITAQSSAPVLALCRKLIEAGCEPTTPLEAWRGQVLCLRIRTLNAGAALTVEDDRHGRPRLRRWRDRMKVSGAGRPVRQIGRATARHHHPKRKANDRPHSASSEPAQASFHEEGVSR